MRLSFGGFFHGFTHGALFELVRRVIAPAILVSIPFFLWWWLGPEKPKCDSIREGAARVAIAQVVERIHEERGEVRRATVLHFAGDTTDFLTVSLRDQLMEKGILDIDGTPSMEKIRSLLNLRNSGTFDVNAAIEYGKKHELDAVIIGMVDVFETVKDKAVLSGSVKFIEIASGRIVEIPLSDRKIDSPLSLIAENSLSEVMPFWQRVLCMIFCVVAVPILVFPFLKIIMRKNSNFATFGLLVMLVALDAFIICISLGMGGTFWSFAVFLISLAAAFGYDLFMLSYAQLCRPSIPGTI